VCLCQNNGHSEPANSKPRAKVDVGKEDPFSELPRKKNKLLVSRRISDVANIEYTPELFVETVTLKFLEAKNLKKAIDSMSSQYGGIATDDTTNSLIICDTKERLEEIIAEIKNADQTPEQIMVEVVIIDVQLDDDTEIGVNWDRLFESKRDESYTQTLAATLSGTSAGTATHGADFSLVKTGISGTIHLLQETRNVEILASPRILVVSGQQASIKTVEEIPYTEVTDSSDGGAAALTSTEFKDVGITLNVKATLTDQRNILMDIEPEQKVKTGESVGDVPIVDTRSAKTSLLMEDGQVVVMGGLRRKETRITQKKVPLLGDLPLVGFLFSNNKEEVNNSELVVLISPHIYKGQPVPEDIMEKYNELEDRPMLSLSTDEFRPTK
jgi:general secretion pathway protein D